MGAPLDCRPMRFVVQRPPQDTQHEGGRSGQDRLDRPLHRAMHCMFSAARGRPNFRGVLWKTGVLSIFLVVGASQIEVFHDDLDMVPDDLPVKEAVRILDQNVGGVATAELVLTRPEGNFKDVDVVQGMDRLIADVLAYSEVDPTTGESKPLVTHGHQHRRHRERNPTCRLGWRARCVPGTPDPSRGKRFSRIVRESSPLELRKLVTVDWTKTHITFRVRWQDATAYGGLINFIEESKDTHLGDSVEVAGTGPVYVGYRLVVVMLRDLAVSFGTAFLCVTLFMIIMLRDFKLGLIAMLPNLFPIVTVVGFMGLTGIPMDLTALLIACIALGIAVDDTVHFLHHFQVTYQTTQSCEAAVRAAAQHAGRAMVATSALLIVGFSIYCFGTNAAIFPVRIVNGFYSGRSCADRSDRLTRCASVVVSRAFRSRHSNESLHVLMYAQRSTQKAARHRCWRTGPLVIRNVV